MQLHISVVDHAQLGCLGWASQGINQEDWGNILSCCHSTLWQYWGFSCEPIASTCHVMEPDIASRDLAERWIHLGKTKSLASQSGADKQVVTPWLSQFWGFMLLSHNILGASETEPRAGDVQIWLEDLPHLLSHLRRRQQDCSWMLSDPFIPLPIHTAHLTWAFQFYRGPMPILSKCPFGTIYKIETLTDIYIISPIKLQPASNPSMSSNPETLQNWDAQVKRVQGTSSKLTPIKLGPSKMVWS